MKSTPLDRMVAIEASADDEVKKEQLTLCKRSFSKKVYHILPFLSIFFAKVFFCEEFYK